MRARPISTVCHEVGRRILLGKLAAQPLTVHTSSPRFHRLTVELFPMSDRAKPSHACSMVRPISAGALPHRGSKIQFKTSTRGLYRCTEPRGAETQCRNFLTDGTVPVLSFKATRDKIQASLSRPLQTVKTGLMSIATKILDSVVERWGCVDDLVNDTRGDSIDRCQAEQFIRQYLEDHNIPGKLQVRWVKCMGSGGKLQEYGRRSNPTGRKLRLWINSGFAGVAYSTSIKSFADHEICTHAVRAINDHSQVRSPRAS